MLQLPSMKRNASSLSSLAAIRSSKSAAMNRCSLLWMNARLQRFLAADLFFNVCSLRSVDLWLLRLSSESKPVPPWSMTLQLPAGPPLLKSFVCSLYISNQAGESSEGAGSARADWQHVASDPWIARQRVCT